MTVRIQRRRTKGWRLPYGAVCVDRSSGFGNPYRVVKAADVATKKKEWWVEYGGDVWIFSTKEDASAAATKLFAAWLDSPRNRALREKAVLYLRGKDLACWCPLHRSCHADVLLEVANA